MCSHPMCWGSCVCFLVALRFFAFRVLRALLSDEVGLGIGVTGLDADLHSMSRLPPSVALLLHGFWVVRFSSMEESLSRGLWVVLPLGSSLLGSVMLLQFR